MSEKVSYRKYTKSFGKQDKDRELDESLDILKNRVDGLTNALNTVSARGDADTYKGKPGDIKINKISKNTYDFYIRGEDGWHKDNNASFGPVDEKNKVSDPPVVNMTSGQFDYSYEGNTRLSLNLDPTKISTSSVATPSIKGYGNLKIESSGTTILQSALQMKAITNAGSDTDKFLVIDSSDNVKFRTGAEVLSDIGGISSDTTLTDEQVQDIVGAMVSGNTETNISVTYDDSSGKLNFASTDTNTTYSEATGSAEGLMSIAHHDKLDGIETGATADQTQADINGLAITTTGALNSGSITSGFGNIDNGTSTLDTGALTATSGTVTGATLTSSAASDKLIDLTQTLNAGIGEKNAMMGESYRMIKTNLTTTNAAGWDAVYLIDQQVGGSSKFNVLSNGNATFGGTVTANNVLLGRFQTQGQYEVYGRYGIVNTWYVGNQNFGTSVTEGDWGGGSKYNYAQFTAVSNVKLIGWKFHGSFSSAVDWEMELWHTETPADGESDPEEATKVGSTQSVSPTASRLYSLGETGLTYSIPAGDQLYLLTRYTSGSGTKYSYGTVGFEFSY